MPTMQKAATGPLNVLPLRVNLKNVIFHPLFQLVKNISLLMEF